MGNWQYYDTVELRNNSMCLFFQRNIALHQISAEEKSRGGKIDIAYKDLYEMLITTTLVYFLFSCSKRIKGFLKGCHIK